MNVTVLYFAVVRELVGKDEERLVLPEPMTIDAFARHLEAIHPALAGRLASVRFARNEVFAEPTERVAEGDVLAVIPPVAGG